MKKIIIFLLLSLTETVGRCQTYQLFSVTPFTQIERINGQWKETLPINLQYNLIKSFGANTSWFIGVGAGAGISFNGNDNGTINLNFPITAYVGGELISGLPAMAIGGGLNAQTGQPIIMINLHFASLPIQPASTRYKSIVSNAPYDQNNIGFNRDTVK